MSGRNAARLLVLSLVSVLLSSSCATLFRGRKQDIPVTSSPAGATVRVNGVKRGTTPTTIELPRGLKGQVIRIEADGYNPLEIRLRRRFSPIPLVGSVLVGAVVGACYFWYCAFAELDASGPEQVLAIILGTAVGIGAGIEGSSGYTLRPTELVVTMTKVDGTARIETIFVPADGLRNVKWIRVRKD